MDCIETRSYIECYVDGELDPVMSAALEKHLQQCSGCKRALEQLDSLRSLIREGAPYYAAPEELSEDIRARVKRNTSAAPKRASAPHWRWLQAGALVAATAGVTWIAASQLNSPSRDELIAAQVIADHARSVLTNHLADVASSDQHTVKPWLSSKLDFSPPVTDLTTAGFPLVGGRLDYLDNRPVAALVYRHRQHVIDLFIWPESASMQATPVRAFTRQGYQVLHWKDAGMTFWAISDLNAADLKSFVENFGSAK